MVFLYIFLGIIVLFLIIPLSLKIEVYWDLARKTVIFNLYLFGIHLIKYRIFIVDTKLFYSLNGCEGKKFKFKKPQTDIKNIFDLFTITKINIAYRYGAYENAFRTAMTISAINQAAKTITAYYDIKNFKYQALPIFSSQCMTINATIKIRLVLIKFLILLQIKIQKAKKEKAYE